MPAITKPNQHFDVLTWSGTGGGSGATRSITGLNFQPDFIWEKARSSGTGHQLLDSVRGVGQNKVIASNSNAAQPNPPNTESLYGWLSAINSDGFTVTNGTYTVYVGDTINVELNQNQCTGGDTYANVFTSGILVDADCVNNGIASLVTANYTVVSGDIGNTLSLDTFASCDAGCL
jgi:hypothetical protein